MEPSWNDYVADTHLIRSEFTFALRVMEMDGRRLGGRDDPRKRGFSHMLANNLLAEDSWGGKVFGTRFYRCYDQSLEVLKRLQRLSLNLEWFFVLANKPGHYWVEAVPVVKQYSFTARNLQAWDEIVNTPLPDGFHVLVLDPLWESFEMRDTPTQRIEGYVNQETNFIFF